MIKVKKNFIYASLIGILLTGCATYSQEDCELIRWDEQGYNDALKALSSNVSFKSDTFYSSKHSSAFNLYTASL